MIPSISVFNPRGWENVWSSPSWISARGQQHSMFLHLEGVSLGKKMIKKSLQHVMINLFYKYFLLAQKMMYIMV